MTDNFVERRANPPSDGGWHLDKKVPLSLIFAMIVQAGMVIWAVADIKKDVELLKHDVMVLGQADSKIETGKQITVNAPTSAPNSTCHRT